MVNHFICNEDVMMFSKVLPILLVITILLPGCRRDKSEWALEIEGKKYSVNEVKAAYRAFFFLMAQQLQATPEQLKEILANPEKAPRPEIAEMIQRELSEEAFLEKYKHLLLLNLEAEKSGYMQKDDLKSKLEFLRSYFVANMYMVEKVKEIKSDIKNEDVESEYIKIKRTNPKAIQNVPITEVMKMIRQQMQMKQMQLGQGKMIEKIVSKYKVETNEKLDPKEYLTLASETEPKKEKKGDSDTTQPGQNKEENSSTDKP